MIRIYVAMLLTITVISSRAQTPPSIDQGKLIEFYQTQRYADALAYLKLALGDTTTNPRALSQIAYSALMAGRLAEAEQYYQRLYQQDSANVSVLQQLASLNLKRGNNSRAELYLRRLVTSDSTNFVAYKQLAAISRARAALGTYSDYLQKANQLNPAEADVAADLSDWYVSLKQLAAAERVLSRALAADTGDVNLLHSYIRLTYAERKWKEVIQAGKQLVNMGDRSLFTIMKLGECYYRLADYQHCVESFTSLSDDQQNETSYYYTAMAYKKMQQQDKAIKYLQLAVQAGISPSVSTYYGEIAGTYQAQRMYPQAIASYQRGFYFEDNPLLYYSLANLYDTRKNRKQAIRYFNKYLALHPVSNQQIYIDYAKSRLAELTQ